MARDGDHEIAPEEKDFQNAHQLTSSRRVYRKKPKAAMDLLNDVIALRGVAAERSNAQLQGSWDAVVGMNVANQTKVGAIRRGVLTVEVANSSLMQMLEFNKQSYLQELNRQNKKTKLKDLRFRIGSIS